MQMPWRGWAADSQVYALLLYVPKLGTQVQEQAAETASTFVQCKGIAAMVHGPKVECNELEALGCFVLPRTLRRHLCFG